MVGKRGAGQVNFSVVVEGEREGVGKRWEGRGRTRAHASAPGMHTKELSVFEVLADALRKRDGLVEVDWHGDF